MNFCERIYWNIRLSLTKDFLFIDGYAAINKISYKSKEDVIKHFFSCKDSNNNGLNPPRELFFKEGYLAEYPDVADVGMDPWVHFVLYGKQEGRDNGLNPCYDLFNKEIYLKLYEDICDSDISPWCHYVLYGKKEGRYSGAFCNMIKNILSSFS